MSPTATPDMPYNPLDWDLDRLGELAKKMDTLREELTRIFPERDHLINQLVFALLTQEHILIDGVWGAGKSDLIDCLLEAIVGSHVFRLSLTRGTTESAVFGIPNPRTMRDEGKIEYDPQFGMFQADLAELDEFLDATAPMLRTLLGPMNERLFKRGHQSIRLRLMTMMASTNGDPYEAMKRDGTLSAVIDRFIFRSRVRWLTTATSRRRMYTKYLKGERTTVRISLDDLRWMSGLVVGAQQITEPQLVDLYDEIMEALRAAWADAEFPRTFSDRTACKILQIVEAQAVLRGRYQVVPDDFYAMRWGICTGGNEEEFELFDETVRPIIERANAANQQSIDQMQISLLEKIKQEIPHPIGGAAMSPQALVERIRSLTALKEETDSIKTQIGSTEDLKQTVLGLIQARIDETDAAIKKE